MSQQGNEEVVANKKCQAIHQGTTIWSFWEGTPPDLVLRCIQSMAIYNPDRPVICLNKETIYDYLDDEEDFPIINGQRANCESFSKVQYLADWVRLTLLEKYGGVWLDASVICLDHVSSWLSETEDRTKVTMFPMHANPNVHGNWAIGSPTRKSPVLQHWRQEMAKVLNEAGPDGDPTAYIETSFETYPALQELWNNPAPPPLPYLWPYLTLQVALQKDPSLHEKIHLLSSAGGPMHRRYLNNPDGKPDDAISERTANHLAVLPLKKDSHDKWFIKLVGTDRQPVQDRLLNKDYIAGSVLHYFSRVAPRPMEYGVNLNFANGGSEEEERNRPSIPSEADVDLLCHWASNSMGAAAPMSKFSIGTTAVKNQKIKARPIQEGDEDNAGGGAAAASGEA